jgi:chromosome segregation ATPase
MLKEMRVIQQQILDILMSMQKDLSEVKSDVTNVKKDSCVLQNDITNMNINLKEVQADIHDVKTTVDRIELAQTEDVIGILKVNKKKTDFEFEY